MKLEQLLDGCKPDEQDRSDESAAGLTTLTNNQTPEIRQCQRDLWILEGILSHKLDQDLLRKVSDNFEKIDCVPSGYFYPELYSEVEK